MSTTDRYKLVPYNGNNLPCDNCPIEYICDVYNQYVIYNEIVGDNDLLNKCLACANDEKTHMIPQLINDGEDTMQTVVEDVNYESEYILVPASKYWTCRACRLIDDCEEEVDNPLFTKCKDAMCDGNPLMPVKIKHGENTSKDSDS